MKAGRYTLEFKREAVRLVQSGLIRRIHWPTPLRTVHSSSADTSYPGFQTCERGSVATAPHSKASRAQCGNPTRILIMGVMDCCIEARPKSFLGTRARPCCLSTSINSAASRSAQPSVYVTIAAAINQLRFSTRTRPRYQLLVVHSRCASFLARRAACTSSHMRRSLVTKIENGAVGSMSILHPRVCWLTLPIIIIQIEYLLTL
jgi:hypothetical protein